MVSKIENLENVINLKKLFISNNRISDLKSFQKLKDLNYLIEINFEGNPVNKQKLDYARTLLTNTKQLAIIDHKSIDSFREEIIQEEKHNNKKD